MRGFRSAFCLAVAAAAIGIGGAAEAASRADCGRGPPAWWNAPRVTYTYSGASYADRSSIRGATHEFAAQRRTVHYSSAPSHSYRERIRRW